MAKIHFLNVGHGDCTIIEHANGNLTMIDVNNGEELDDDSTDAILEKSSSSSIEYLHRWTLWKSRSVPVQNLLAEAGYDIELTNPIEFLQSNYPNKPVFRYIQTHPDFDHMRGLAALESSEIEIVNFWDTPNSREWDPQRDSESDRSDWDAYQKYRSGSGPKVLNLYRGSVGRYFNRGENDVPGGNGLYILSPTTALFQEFDVDGRRNELSYVLQYRIANRTIILGGDAEQAAWESIYQEYGGKLKCDVLKASHHGRDSGYHQEAVKAMSPAVVIVSVGKKPDSDAGAKYSNYSKEVASTRWYGDITLEIDSDGNMSWTTSKQRKTQAH
jgi:competence protein ComEC